MSIRSISEHAFVLELNWLHEVLSESVHELSWRVASQPTHIPKIPRRVGEKTAPYYLGADLFTLYQFARGHSIVTPDFVKDMIELVASLLFQSPFERASGMPVPSWKPLESRPLGEIFLAAQARAKLGQSVWINERELEALTGLTPKKAERQKVETKPGPDGVSFSPNDVQHLLMRLSGSLPKIP